MLKWFYDVTPLNSLSLITPCYKSVKTEIGYRYLLSFTSTVDSCIIRIHLTIKIPVCSVLCIRPNIDLLLQKIKYIQLIRRFSERQLSMLVIPTEKFQIATIMLLGYLWSISICFADVSKVSSEWRFVTTRYTFNRLLWFLNITCPKNHN